jgi:hypothetical protein
LRQQWNSQRALQSAFDAGIKKVEFRIGQLAFSDGAVEGRQKISQERVFQYLKIGLHRFGVDADVPPNLGKIQDPAVHLGRDFQKVTERLQLSNDLLVPDFFFQNRQRPYFPAGKDGAGESSCRFLARRTRRNYAFGEDLLFYGTYSIILAKLWSIVNDFFKE